MRRQQQYANSDNDYNNSLLWEKETTDCRINKQAKALALVDCVQDTYSNVASLIDDSVYNMEGGMEDDLEKMMLDLTKVDPRVTTIVAGVRSLSMTFKVH